ncbi:MAG: sulfatase-like hydrolase/transferase [Nitrososphaerota archaeon]|nr:sulfatase-like hydrolase/transferase [Nitrososphaerota archaeon]
MAIDRPNIFLIIFDTMRKDVLSIYDGRSSTPNIDNFSKDCIICPNAISPAPWTSPSHASFFTGKYPSGHGVHETDVLKLADMKDVFLNAHGHVLAEELRSKGYTTIGYSANGVAVSAYLGFDRGFDLFSNFTSVGAAERLFFLREATRELEGLGGTRREILIKLLKKGQLGLTSRLIMQNQITRRNERKEGFPFLKGANAIVSNVLRSTMEEPFFLFINLMEIHEPYFEDLSDLKSGHLDTLGIRPISRGKLLKLRKLYYKEATVIDKYFGILLDFIKRIGWYDSSLIIVASDHGQSLKEDSFYGHAIYLKDEIIQVPLLIKLPNNKKIKPSGYQSTSVIYDVIRTHADGDFDPECLSMETVFAESYGSPTDWTHEIQRNLQDILELTKSRDLFDTRKAVLKKGYKLSVNGTRGTVEEFKYNGVEVNVSDHRAPFEDLLEELEIFRGKEKFNLPEVRFGP